MKSIHTRAAQADAAEASRDLARMIGNLISVLDGGPTRYFPTPLSFDSELLRNGSRSDLSAAIDAHLIEVTRENGCYATDEAAARDLRVFHEIYLDNISFRALRTLYIGYCFQLDVTVEYLKAIELLRDDVPMGFDDRTEVIYFKLLDDDRTLQRVAQRSERDDVRNWAQSGLDRRPCPPAAHEALDKIWAKQIPFQPYAQNARVYQIGRKQGAPLSGRDGLDELGLAYKPAERQSIWLSSRGFSKTKPKYFALLKQEMPSIPRRRLEQVSLDTEYCIRRLTTSAAASFFWGL